MPHVRGLQVTQSLRGQQRDGSAVGLSPAAAPASASARLQPCLPWALCYRPREAGEGTLGTTGHGQGRLQTPGMAPSRVGNRLSPWGPHS